MNRIVRTSCPDWLEKKYKIWGKEWETKYNKNHKSTDFKWRQDSNKGYNDLIEKLSAMTNKHCSYCDSYPIGSRIPYTIDHFRPKTKYPLLAYVWHNLFICCGICQKRGNNFDKKILKPDTLYYDFDKYFEIDTITGEIKANNKKSNENIERAKITIELMNLNENGKPEDRLEELNSFLDSNNPMIDRFSYRFFIKAAISKKQKT